MVLKVWSLPPHHPHTPSSITITRDLIRKANSQARSQVTWIRNSKSRAQKSIFQQALQVTPNSLKYRLSSKNQWHRILFLAGGFHSILPSNIWSSNFLAIHIWETVDYTKKFFIQILRSFNIWALWISKRDPQCIAFKTLCEHQIPFLWNIW